MRRSFRLTFMIAALLVVARASDGEIPVSLLTAWGDTLSIDSRVLAEITRYADEKGDFSDGYAERLAQGVRRLIFDAVDARLRAALDGECEPVVDVFFPKPGFAVEESEAPTLKSETKFEKSFVRTEMVACFDVDGVSPEEALRIYTSTEFRMRVASRIERIWDEAGENCVKVSGVTAVMGPMNSCSRITELHAPGLASHHSQTVSNDGDEGNQLVFFKESVKTFVATPDGLVLHYINYSRTTGMGALKKKIGRGKIRGSQERAVEELQRIFSGPGE